MFLIQNENNVTYMLSDSYEEWAFLIQKLKERNSQIYNSDAIFEPGNDPVTNEEE